MIVRKISLVLVCVCSVLHMEAQQRGVETNQSNEPFDVLLFTKTEGFRHESIETGVEVLLEQSIAHDFFIVHTEDADLFISDILDSFEVIVFLSTTGDILDAEQQAAMEAYIQSGKGFVGIHAATDTEHDWPWYNGLVGAYFSNHPPGLQEARIMKVGAHYSTNHLPLTWIRTDEWYNFKSLSSKVQPILNLDESSYAGGEMGGYHPIAWYQQYDGGRSWYTAGGHSVDSFFEDDFVKHLVGGILWAAGRVKF